MGNILGNSQFLFRELSDTSKRPAVRLIAFFHENLVGGRR
jgi:hypothetical protein